MFKAEAEEAPISADDVTSTEASTDPSDAISSEAIEQATEETTPENAEEIGDVQEEPKAEIVSPVEALAAEVVANAIAITEGAEATNKSRESPRL